MKRLHWKPYTQDKMILTINKKRLQLESLGTGLHEIILLCSALIVHQNNIVCIEEPEIHLHPELQRKFFDFLLKTNNQYFISTHSNVFLDCAKELTSVFHCQNNGVKTTITKRDTNKHTRAILADLGYRNSDLFHSNGIIWVEGPSDRIYLNKWIQLKDNTLKEGFHYSIMFYGGKLLSHLSGGEELVNEEFIDLLKINKNAFVLIDSDRIGKRTTINSTKRRLQSEIGESNCWITIGKEIENYLTGKTVTKWLSTKSGKEMLFSWEAKQAFNDAVSAIMPKIRYQISKTDYSREIVNYITSEDLKVSDLQEKINNLCSVIKQWNS